MAFLQLLCFSFLKLTPTISVFNFYKLFKVKSKDFYSKQYKIYINKIILFLFVYPLNIGNSQGRVYLLCSNVCKKADRMRHDRNHNMLGHDH